MLARRKGTARNASCAVVLCVVGCGIASPPAPSSLSDAADFGSVDTSSVAASSLLTQPPTGSPVVDSVQADPWFPFPVLVQDSGSSVDILGLLLDALLVDLLAPVGPRLDDSMTFLERLCLDGDEPDSYCRRRYGR